MRIFILEPQPSHHKMPKASLLQLHYKDTLDLLGSLALLFLESLIMWAITFIYPLIHVWLKSEPNFRCCVHFTSVGDCNSINAIRAISCSVSLFLSTSVSSSSWIPYFENYQKLWIYLLFSLNFSFFSCPPCLSNPLCQLHGYYLNSDFQNFSF